MQSGTFLVNERKTLTARVSVRVSADDQEAIADEAERLGVKESTLYRDAIASKAKRIRRAAERR